MFALDAIINFIRMIFSFFLTKEPLIMQSDKLKIFVKCGSETMIPVFLETHWTVYDLKSAVGSKLCLNSDDLRIIFAGKELHDNVKLEDCDVGEQSVIHAIQQKKRQLDVSVEAKCPLNQTPFCSDSCEENEVRTYSKKKSHFFVYCNFPCNALCPGKLRVRCSTCKDGTLTVEQDPTCWDDVLLPGRISGICQAENCNGTVAEFFFKCANHIASSDEWAVPLYLVKNNFKNVPCIACTGERPLVLVFPCVDQHVICIECFRLYCTSRLNERRFQQDETVGYSIECPAGCPDSLIKEPHHFKLLGEEQYSRYQRFGAEEYLLQAGGVLCPQPGCGAGLLPDPECTRVVCVQAGGGGCGFVFCRLCMQGFHIGPCESQDLIATTDGVNYAIIDERASTSKWDEDSKKIIKITTKPCPKCRTPTERDGGCMHMVCTRSQCGFHWCWVCQEEWTRDCMGNHWFG